MIRSKYGAVIGRITRFFNVPSYNFQAMGFVKPITAPYLTLIIKPRNFAKRQCKLPVQWLLTPLSTGGPPKLYILSPSA
jgi:hypothetical protein